ncbi:alpha/beta hydrolase [Actibacterium sp. 188UL27-1]|uniref:alpha/beta hydrolase n=1 Tax=Actibacterium sp. 188UL27-1 TaxID=2786961 RepID=UPI0019585217|nr:alpha/beta fold hydrolase [Actibacterium sp. 188UL27-1]MBM7069456.1 alpha/beta hydrolase [Actibacterium sp. 188UL27-1]
MHPRHMTRWGVLVLALGLGLWSVTQLERLRGSVDRTIVTIGTTPAMLYAGPQADAPVPLVILAHGFAGSRQFMEAFALTLARSGYAVLSYDLQGHGRNPVPMSPEVTEIDGTTRALMDELSAVIAAGRDLPGMSGDVALLGHSMSTDVIIREALRNPDVDGVVAVSMYSQAITASEPGRMLILSGEWEPHLREFGRTALQMVDPAAQEGETAEAENVWRRAVFAPRTEHVGVLYSATSLTEARAFLDLTFDRSSDGPVTDNYGLFVVLLVSCAFIAAWPVLTALPVGVTRPDPLNWRQIALVTLVPAGTAPVIASALSAWLLPVQVVGYLTWHFAAYGILQMIVLAWCGRRLTRGPVWPAIVLIAYGLGVFGLALDRYGASFMPNMERLAMIPLLMVGTIPCMVADGLATGGGTAPVWQRLWARVAVIGSLILAVVFGPDRLFLMMMVLPVIVLFFLVYGSMAGWLGRRQGGLASGLGLAVLLAWSIAVSFPMFAV